MPDFADHPRLPLDQDGSMRRTLEERGLLRREPDPTDGRAALAVLTKRGLEALRRAQVVHHAAVRELYLDRLTPNDLNRLARLFEKALPGVISATVWPPPTLGDES